MGGGVQYDDFKEDRRMPIPHGFIVRLHERWSDWRACRRDLTPDQIAAWMQESWSLLPAYTVTYPADPVKAENTCARAAKTYVARHRGWFATAGQATAEGTTLVVGP